MSILRRRQSIALARLARTAEAPCGAGANHTRMSRDRHASHWNFVGEQV